MGKPDILAAGCVVLARVDGHLAVALVHRPKYNDWSLPKGKALGHEPGPVTAVRETREETGLQVRLGQQLGRVEYRVGSRAKQVTWWLARPAGASAMPPIGRDRIGEIDQREWVRVDEALTLLTYEDDRDVLATALAAGPSTPLLVVRHAKALARSEWSGPDYQRTLSERGRRQARALVGVLAAYGVGRLASSSATRCVETLTPYSRVRDLPLRTVWELSEEAAAADPARVATTVQALRADAADAGSVLAICGHRPVLPGMFAALGVANEAMKTAALRVIFYAGGAPVAVDHLESPL